MPPLHPPRPLIKNIAFFGDANVPPTSQIYKDAFAIAKLLGESGYTIVNGGGPGVMTASTKGAEASGGETLTVTFTPKDAPGFEGRYLGNIPDKEIKTKNYIERMFKLMEHSDCFIMFNGGTGTLSEFATAWALGRLYYPHHKPFVLYGKFWQDIIKLLKVKMKLRESDMKVFRVATNKQEVMSALSGFEDEMAKFDHRHCKICQDKAFLT